MSLKVSEQDKRRVKNTTIVFCAIFLICAILAGVFVCLIPRTQQKTSVGANGEQITSMVEAHDGKTYYLQSKNWFCEYDAYTGDQLSSFNLTDEIGEMLSKKGVQLRDLNNWRVSAFSGEQNDYFIVSDADGNIFKLKKNAQGKLEVTEDYYLLPKQADGKILSKDIKGLDSIGDKIYFLFTENNFFYVEEYDMESISQGPSKRKFLWDIGPVEEDGYKQVEALKASTGVLAFYAHDDHLLFIKKGGGIIRLSTELVDSVDADGQVRDFFVEASQEDAIPEDIQEQYDTLYNQTRNDYLRGDLATYCVKKVVENGTAFTVKVEDTANGVPAETISQLLDGNGQPFTSEGIKSDATKYAEAQAVAKALFEECSYDEISALYAVNELALAFNGADIKAKALAKSTADALLADSEWFKEYDASKMSMLIKTEYFDEKYYASFIPGESTINGMTYSKVNNAIYYTNASDGYLYVVKRADLESAKMGDSVSGMSAKRIDNIHCGKNQTFSDFGNGLGYNKFANTLYLKFANERQVTIVDINNESDVTDCTIISTYTGTFDMFTLSGDETNSVTQVMHQVTKVDMKGIDHNYLYVCTYEPERFENKTVITILFVVFLAIAIVAFFLSLWLLLSLRTENGVKKVVFIAKDTKKNKFVYLALFFFIAMLIMFCYYEAIGAIAMSFFDYTKEKPAWIWNNFANFIKIFNDKYFLPSIINMLIFLVADVLLSIIPPIIFAILLILIRNKVTSNWIRSLMFVPGIIPSIAGMLIWRVGIYGDDGLLNQVVMAFGGQKVNWLLNKDYARWSLIMMGFPFVGGYLIFYGGMMNIPNEYHEAGKLEGLSTIKRFLKIDIPLIKPQIKYVFITVFIASVQNFARTHILQSTVVMTPVQTMYTMMTKQGDYGMSSAYATLIFIFLFAAIATNFKMQKQDAMGADL